MTSEHASMGGTLLTHSSVIFLFLCIVSVFLSDFGLVGNEVQGGTPIFASPECYAVKTTKSDIFSLGRVFLFVLLVVVFALF